MKVLTYQPNQVETQSSNHPLASADVPLSSFGGPVNQGIQQIAVAAIEMGNRIATTEAEEAMVGFERDKNSMLFNPEDGYFNTQGRNAFDGATTATKSLDELKNKYSESLSQNARVMFDKTAANHITRAQQDIGRHASKGFQAWEVATLESQVENSVENAALYWKDDQAMKVQNVLGRQAILDASEKQGLSHEAINERLQTFDSSFTRTAIEAATASSAGEGRQLMEKLGDRLEGPDKTKLNAIIDHKALAEQTKADAQFAVIKGGQLAKQFGDRQQIIDAAESIKDPVLRDKVVSEAMHQHSVMKQAESETRAQSFEAAEAHMLGGGTAETFKAENPGAWLAMSPKQQKIIESGKANSTDWDTFSDLMVMPKKDLANIDPNDYFNVLAPAERGKLITAVKAAKGGDSEKADAQIGRTRTAQTKAAVEQIYGARTAKNKDNDDRNFAVENFYSMVDEEVAFREQQKNGKLTSEEYTNLVNGFTRKVVVEGKIFDSTKSLKDVPTEHVGELTAFLRSKNIPVTTDNLLNLYQQASK